MKDGFSGFAGIDTEEIYSHTLLNVKDYPFIYEKETVRVTCSGNDPRYIYRINPNTMSTSPIYHFSDYSAAMDSIDRETGLRDRSINRIDFCLDNYDHDYRDLLRITQLLFLLIVNYLGIKNDYLSKGLQSPVEKTIRLQGGCWDAEFYNKAIQDPNSGIKTRLELRSKRLKSKSDVGKEAIELEKWFDLLEKSTAITATQFDSILFAVNKLIMQQYQEDVIRGEYRKRDFNSLIQRYYNYIFSGCQLKNLFQILGYKEPDVQTSKYKKKHGGMEFFKISDIQRYVKFIIERFAAFLAS